MNSDRRFKTLIEFKCPLEKIHPDLYMPTDESYERKCTKRETKEIPKQESYLTKEQEE